MEYIQSPDGSGVWRLPDVVAGGTVVVFGFGRRIRGFGEMGVCEVPGEREVTGDIGLLCTREFFCAILITLEEDLLCPFHYFGITDLGIDGEVDSAVVLQVFCKIGDRI